MKEQDAAHSFECAGCGAEINEGEFKTFGVCDACWDEGVTKKYWGPKKEHKYTDKEIIALAEDELTRLRSELEQLKAWKKSEMEIWTPVLEYMQKHPDVRLGERISERVLEFLKERDLMKSKAK